ncbi:MAG: hypothetical protein ACI4ON_00205 [Clostridia bacterium]
MHNIKRAKAKMSLLSILSNILLILPLNLLVNLIIEKINNIDKINGKLDFNMLFETKC